MASCDYSIRLPMLMKESQSSPRFKLTWKLRCKTAGGCVKASSQIVGPAVATGERELLYVDYFVVGANGSTVIRGQRSPIYFEPTGSRWLIKQFGDQIVAKPRAPRHDAGPRASPDGSSP